MTRGQALACRAAALSGSWRGWFCCLAAGTVDGGRECRQDGTDGQIVGGLVR
jgi:hypothetical protein